MSAARTVFPPVSQGLEPIAGRYGADGPGGGNLVRDFQSWGWFGTQRRVVLSGGFAGYPELASAWGPPALNLPLAPKRSFSCTSPGLGGKTLPPASRFSFSHCVRCMVRWVAGSGTGPWVIVDSSKRFTHLRSASQKASVWVASACMTSRIRCWPLMLSMLWVAEEISAIPSCMAVVLRCLGALMNCWKDFRRKTPWFPSARCRSTSSSSGLGSTAMT
mmetsp:Transcript_25790/g.62376  ORF Transcript_25790/g.62376 Transcript_25790/m.62376 type:complete len:218 (+) Transcript_25790:228-881(+)